MSRSIGRGLNGGRRALIGSLATLLLAALPAAGASAQAPGLPLGYDFKTIDSGAPAPGTSFGWGAASADLTGDGEADLLVAQGQGSPTHVFVYDGVTGQLLHDITPPEGPNPGGGDPVIGFVYAEAMPDIGSCPGGSPGADNICDLANVAAGDGIPEISVGARATRVDADPDDGDEGTRNSTDPQIGRGYVLDGASAGSGETVILKRIDMPVADRRLTNSLGGGAAQFARVMTNPQGLPPCDGPASELNNLGIGPCPGGLNDADPIFGKGVRIGDVNGGGEPDLVLTARNFRESIASTDEQQMLKVDATAGNYTLSFGGVTTGNIAHNATAATVDAALEGLASIGAGGVTVTGGPGGAGGDTPYTITFAGTLADTDVDEIVATDVDLSGGGGFAAVHTIRDGGSSAPAGSECASATSGNCAAGKAWVYAGENIAGSDPGAILETPLHSIQSPFATTTNTEFGGNVWRIGDVSNAAPGLDGRPEFVIADRNIGYPLEDPDETLFPNVGVAYLFNGATGARIATYPHPEPQARATFGASFNSGRPAGDLGLTGLPDVVIPAPLQNNIFADDGTAYVFRGDQNSPGGGGQGGWQFAQMDDPTPITGGGFGSSTTGVGNLVDAPATGANEMLIGSWAPFDPFTEPIQSAVGDVHIVNPQNGVNLQTIKDPSGEADSGFGVSMTPMGDLNDDGFLDFGITAYLSDAVASAGGRAYILYSDNTSPSVPTPPTALASGRCANAKSGTEGDDTLQGTESGDTLFGLGGNDTVSGLGAADCLDGGLGRDAVDGGGGGDSLLGGGGRDRLLGGAGGDRLFGEGGKDALVGGEGKDFVSGGKGRDKVKVRGGGSDEVNCGKGKDVVVGDRSDKVSANCERVRD